MEKASKGMVVIMLLIAALIAGVIVWCVASDNQKREQQETEARLQKEIVEKACEEINGEPSWEVEADSEYASLTLLSKESIPWSDWDGYEYVLKVDGHRFTVGVLRNDKEIHFVDVEEDITGRSGYGTVTKRG